MTPGMKEKYQSVLDNIEELYYEVDLAGNLTFFNEPATRILGYTGEELTGMNNRRYMSPETAKRVYETFNQVYRTGKPARAFDWEVIRKDGTIRVLETSVSLMRDSKGRAIGFYGIGRDVTERKQVEAALQASEEKYRTILNSIEEGYYEVDLAGNFTFFNDFLVKSLGYTKGELMGMNNRQYMSPETARLVYETFHEVYRTGNPKRDFEWELIRKDGTKRFVEVSVSLMRNKQGQAIGFYGIARDITERKRAEEEERNFRRAKDKVLDHLSHELRTPLSIIQGGIRLLKRKLQAQGSSMVGGDIFENLERNLTRLFDIEKEADKIIRSHWEVENCSFLSGLKVTPSAEKETIFLHSFVQKALEEAKRKASHRDIRIILEGGEGLTLDAPPPMVLSEMFTGLLRNAIENTPDEGLIRIVLERKGEWIQVKFVDFGIGITQENQRHLFEGLAHTLDTELYRSKKPYDFGAGGKGLDLLRMKVYSKRFGFDISMASRRCLYLPTDREVCPGRISECPQCRTGEDCFSSGGTTFCLSFAVSRCP
jgi:PAS domain S-box-containing protein